MLKYKRGCINDTASRKLMIVVSPTFEICLKYMRPQ